MRAIRQTIALVLAASISGTLEASPRAPASATGTARVVDERARRHVAAGTLRDDLSAHAETPELAALRAAEREVFLPALDPTRSSLPTGVDSPVRTDENVPLLDDPESPAAAPALVPPAAPASAPGLSRPDWTAKLVLSDLPVKWDARLVRYLEFFKSDPRGRNTFSVLYKRSGRYRNHIQSILRKKGLPSDLLFLAMMESGFHTGARSSAGAAGMWQFTPAAAHSYGLPIDRWVDQRLNFAQSTEAAVDYLADLYQRFGTWELAMASYDMGYGAMTAVIKRYNCNDYWTLSHTESALPWEATLYVPKIVAAAIVSRNLEAFGYKNLAVEPSIEFDEISVPAGTSLATIAQAAKVPTPELVALNPELRAQRTPPVLSQPYMVKIPKGLGRACAEQIASVRAKEPVETCTVRFGETLDDVAEAHGTTPAKLIALNAIARGESIRGGSILLVPMSAPKAKEKAVPSKAPAAERPRMVVPAHEFQVEGTRRVFYRVIAGDTLDAISQAFDVSTEDLRKWNEIDPAARLFDGMSLQVFVESDAELDDVRYLEEKDTHVVSLGSEAFFAKLEKEKGFRRAVVIAKQGETLESVGRRYGVAAKTMERVNQKSRKDTLAAGTRVIVYLPAVKARASASAKPPPAGPRAH
jgi:membrane-bound lytic murein transglycosylase D